MEKKTVIFGIVSVALIVGSFFGGTMYEKRSLQSQGLLRNGNLQGRGGNGNGFAVGTGGGSGRTGAARPGMGGGFATGQILSKDDASITIQSPDGGSKIVYISGTTAVLKADPATGNDLLTGERVRVVGKTSPDGSVAADSIEILPRGMVPAGTSGGVQ